jgi:hypothetical protein
VVTWARQRTCWTCRCRSSPCRDVIRDGEALPRQDDQPIRMSKEVDCSTVDRETARRIDLLTALASSPPFAFNTFQSRVGANAPYLIASGRDLQETVRPEGAQDGPRHRTKPESGGLAS